MPQAADGILYSIGFSVNDLDRNVVDFKSKLVTMEGAVGAFSRDAGRKLAQSIDFKNFEPSLARAKQILTSLPKEAAESFNKALGAQASRQLFRPLLNEAETFAGKLRASLRSGFDIKSLALGAASGFGLAAIGREILGFGRDAIVFAAQFETALAKIKTIAGDVDLSNVRGELEELSRQVPQDLLTLSEGLFNIIGSGVRNSADAFKVLDVAARAATAGFTDTKFAADAVVFVMNAFGQSAKDAEEIANVLFKTVDVGKIEFAQLASNIGEVANPAKAAGVSLKELGQLIAATTIGGTPVSEAFTGIKNLLSSIIAPSVGAEKALKALSAEAGVVGVEFSKAGIAAAGGLSKFIQKIQEITGGDPKKLEQLFPEKRALRIAQIVTDNLAPAYQKMGEEFDRVTAKSGDMQKAMEIANATIENQVKLLKNNLSVAVVELGNNILNFLKPSIEGINDIFAGKETSILGKFIAVIGRDIDLINKQLAEIGETTLPLTTAELLKIVKSTKAVSDNVQTLTATTEKPIFLKTTDELERMVDLGGEQAELAKAELKKREEIEKVIKSTNKELELLSAGSPFERELVGIKQRFDEVRIQAHGNLTAIRQIAILEQLEISKAVDKILEITAKDLFSKAGGENRFQAQVEVFAKKGQKAVEKIGDDIKKTGKDLDNETKRLEELEKVRLRREQLIKQSALDLADLIDRQLGNLTISFLDFFDRVNEQGASTFSNIIVGASLFNTVLALQGSSIKNILGSLAKGLFGDNEKQARILQSRAEAEARNQEEATQRLDDFATALQRTIDALQGANIQELEKQLMAVNSEIDALSGKNLQNSIDALIRQRLETQRMIDELLKLPSLSESQRIALESLKKALISIDAQIADLKSKQRELTSEEKEKLRLLEEQRKKIGEQLDLFGKLKDNFDGLLETLNFRFDVLNVDDPIKKLAALQKAIQDKFKAIIPTTEAGIRILIEQGLAALEAGGQTLVDFLKSLDLEELTADQFRDLLQLLNNLANEAKSKVSAIGGAVEDLNITAIRQITFTQGNKLIDETVTMRVIQTQILEIMLNSSRANFALPDFRGFAPAGKNNIFIFNDGGFTQANETDLRPVDRRNFERAIAASRARGLN